MENCIPFFSRSDSSFYCAFIALLLHLVFSHSRNCKNRGIQSVLEKKNNYGDSSYFAVSAVPQGPITGDSITRLCFFAKTGGRIRKEADGQKKHQGDQHSARGRSDPRICRGLWMGG